MKDYNIELDKVSFYTPQFAILEDNIIINKNGSVQKIYKYQAKDLENYTKEALLGYRNVLNNMLKRLEGGYILNFEVQRNQKKDFTARKTEFEVFNIISDEKYQDFKNCIFYENEFYLSITKLIPSETKTKLSGFFVEEDSFKTDIDMFLEVFKKEIKEIEMLAENLFLDFEELSVKEIYTYLHSCVSDNRQKVRVPSIPSYIADYICDRDMINALNSKIGNKYFKCITFNDTPLYSYPNMLEGLAKLGIEYRWCTRYIVLDKLEAKAKLEKRRRIVFGQRYSVFESIKAKITNTYPKVTNPEAEEEANLLQKEIVEVENNNLSEGYFSTNIILYGNTIEELEEKVRIVNKFFIDKEFITIIENINNTEAFLGSIPANYFNNIRTSLLHSIHLSHLIPASQSWSGEKFNKKLKDEALFLAKTKGTTPFYFNIHYKDLGHTMIVGKSGAGKSVLLGYIALNFMKYKNSKVIYFDKGGSQRVLTYALNGVFNDIGKDKMSFQPFENIDDVSERKKASQFLEELLELNNIEITPEIQFSLWEALTNMASNDKSLRTFTTLESIYNSNINVKILLKDYTLTGSQGELFEGDINPLANNRFQIFEMNKISENQKGIALVLSYLFNEIENNLNGEPTLIILDECWKFLDNKRFSDKIKEWLKVLRKKNTSVIFATQELSDIANSMIADTLSSQVATKIFLPNKEIRENYELYKKFGLNETEITNLEEAIPKKEYFLKNNNGARMFDLDLKENGLRFLTKSEDKDQNLSKDLYNKVGGGNIFTEKWIEFMKLEEEIEALKNNIKKEKLNLGAEDIFSTKLDYINSLEKELSHKEQELEEKIKNIRG